MNRFFVNREQVDENNIDIVGEDVRHIKNVLRLRENEEIEIICDGMVYLSKIIEIGSKSVRAEVIDKYKGTNESDVDIYLYQGMAKGNRMDLILQKCTEIGVKKIYPIETHRTIVKLKGDKKINSRLERWNQITLEASKQSKRDIVPSVENIMDFDELCKKLRDEKFVIVPYELESTQGFKEALSDFDGSEPIHIIIGPEGGFEEDEIFRLEEIGAKSVTLGPRILRTETAGVVASTMALYEFGDLGVR